MNMTYFGALNPDLMKAFGHKDGGFYEFLIKPRNEQFKIRVREEDISGKLKELYFKNFFGLIYSY